VPSWVRRCARVVSVALPWVVGLFYVLTAREFRHDDTLAAHLVALVLAVVQGAALWWRGSRPELVTAVTVAAGIPYHAIVPEIGIPFAPMIALWSLALNRPPRVSLIGLGGVLGLMALSFFTVPFDEVLFVMVVIVGLWALAEAARSRRAAIRDAARRAVADEQARLARELHDVIAHSVAVIVVQAGAADDVFDARPDEARAALRSIADTGRDALRELRRLLGAVRPEGTTGPTAPQPGLEQLDQLAEPLRAAGLTVVVTREGAPADLPAGVDVSAYRIVQEALTNTLRHARASVAEVTCRYRSDALEIEVVDDGRGADARSGGDQGFGLVGMRERAALLGGSLDAGPTAHGGYRVHALLPLDSAS
jgi:signal transduction histidine kinase